MSDSVRVPRAQLVHMQDELKRLVTLLDEVGRERAHISMLERRIVALLLMSSDPDKTPVRPPSQQAFEAFKLASEFADGSKKK